MAEEQGFSQARARLEEIVVQVRKKDTSLEQSLDLLEEGVRLANQCTELVDHSEWRPSSEMQAEGEGDPAVEDERTAEVEGLAGSGQATADNSDAESNAEGDTRASLELQDGDASPTGTGAAGVAGDAMDGASDAEASDEYDDIFADED